MEGCQGDLRAAVCKQDFGKERKSYFVSWPKSEEANHGVENSKAIQTRKYWEKNGVETGQLSPVETLDMVRRRRCNGGAAGATPTCVRHVCAASRAARHQGRTCHGDTCGWVV